MSKDRFFCFFAVNRGIGEKEIAANSSVILIAIYLHYSIDSKWQLLLLLSAAQFSVSAHNQNTINLSINRTLLMKGE